MFLRLLVLILLVPNVAMSVCDTGCRLPECFCDYRHIPNGLALAVVPQMVSFTFTGAVTEKVREKINDIFTASYRNPNGCSIGMTFYVLGQYTASCSLHQLYVRGHEIAVQAHNTSWPDAWTKQKWANQISGFRDFLSKSAYVPLSEITGMRAPMLHPGGDKQFAMLEDGEFRYDSTLLSLNTSLWPHTLYTPWEECVTPKYCPTRAYPSLWEIPITPLIHSSGRTCTFLDECVTTNSMRTHKEILQLLMSNFERQYVTSRVPLQVNIRADSLLDIATLTALQRFLDYLTDREDTWVVTATDIIEWIQYPVTYKAAEVFEPWSCPDRKYNRVCSPFNGTGSRVAVLHDVVDGFTLIIWQVVFLSLGYVALFIYDQRTEHDVSDTATDGY